MEQSNSLHDSSLFPRVDQIGVVVRDVDKSVRYYEMLLGEGAFAVAEGEGAATLSDGTQSTIKGKLAFAQMGELQLELIEIKEGRSCHVDFLESSGEGIHHIGMYVSDFDETLKTFTDKGIKVLQSGQSMRRYAYLDTKPVIMELIENSQ